MAEITPNERQQECIDNINGKYLVLAGPGTGKTFTVVHRLKAMLDKGIEPNKILCLSYSDAAAGEMRKKISKFFGVADLGVNIYTYHSFCNEIIAQNIDSFELADNYRPINDTISKQFIKECIDEYSPIAFVNDRNDPYVYFKQIKAGIEEIKKSRVTKGEYFRNIEINPDYQPAIENLKIELEELKAKSDKTKRELNRMDKIPSLLEDVENKIQKAKEIWDYYELYKAKMENEQYIDFDDMISLVLDKFENSPAFLDKIANKYEYIMVDEYQDTNKSQNQIVFDLVHALSSQNVFVVGDDDQIIYSFQGASLDTIGGYLKEFPDTKVICLKENMRSTQKILDLARLIAVQDDRRLEINPEFTKFNIDKSLIAQNEDIPNKDVLPRLNEYYSKEQECIEIVQEIEKLVLSDECPKNENGEKDLSQIAVILKGHEEIAVYAQLLTDRNIPIELKNGKSIFDIKSSIVLYYYLQTLVNPEVYSNQLFKLLLLPPFNITPADYKILFENYSRGVHFVETMRTEHPWQDKDRINSFINTYDKLREYSASETVKNTVMEAGAKTGIFEYFLNEEIGKNDNIAGLKKLIDEAKDFSSCHHKISLEDFVEYLIMVENDSDLDISVDKPDVSLNAIQLTTYHSAKGKEYEYVYMPSLQSNKWEANKKSFRPTIPTPNLEWHDEDYWREYKVSDAVKTMYVGMTRAIHTLRLSYFLSGSAKPSCWITKAKDEHKVASNNYTEYNLETHYLQAGKALVKRPYDYKRDFKEQINAKLKNKYYSASSINKYIKCPRMFLYDDILGFSTISGNPDALSYGSAVHKALCDIVRKAKEENQYMTKEEFIEIFKNELDTLPVSSYEKRKVIEGRGENELNVYYNQITSMPIANYVNAEHPLKTELDGINFVGYIDLVLRNDDGSCTIVDYKTGKYPTISDIAPDKEHEDYYNQICLYKYYYEQIEKEHVSETKLVYTVKPDKHIPFYFTEIETQAVVDKFKNAVKSIENHEFEPSYNKIFCKNCGYKEFCKINTI